MCLSQFQSALSPVSISIHDTRAPARSVVHEVNCALERLARLTDNAVTNLKGEESSFNKGRVQIKDYVEICGWLFTSMRSPKPLTWNRSTDGNLFSLSWVFPTHARSHAHSLLPLHSRSLSRSVSSASFLFFWSLSWCACPLSFFSSLDHSVPQSLLNFLYVISPFLFPYVLSFLKV